MSAAVSGCHVAHLVADDGRVRTGDAELTSHIAATWRASVPQHPPISTRLSRSARNRPGLWRARPDRLRPTPLPRRVRRGSRVDALARIPGLASAKLRDLRGRPQCGWMGAVDHVVVGPPGGVDFCDRCRKCRSVGQPAVLFDREGDSYREPAARAARVMPIASPVPVRVSAVIRWRRRRPAPRSAGRGRPPPRPDRRLRRRRSRRRADQASADHQRSRARIVAQLGEQRTASRLHAAELRRGVPEAAPPVAARPPGRACRAAVAIPARPAM